MMEANAARGLTADLSAEECQSLTALLRTVARHAEAIEQSIGVAERLANSGVLAAVNAVLDDFDENFSAITRPELMGMVANLMMVLGAVSESPYQPFFDTAMYVPGAINAAYPRFRAREEEAGLRELISLLRRPEVIGALQMIVAVLHAQRGNGVVDQGAQPTGA